MVRWHFEKQGQFNKTYETAALQTIKQHFIKNHHS